MRQPLPGCVVEMAGIGEPGEGWTLLRKDGSLWRTPWAVDATTHPSAERDHFFDDKQVLNLVDAEGEALSACAVTADKKLYCWGRNDFGQLGDGTKQEHADPVEVKALGAHVLQVGMSDTFGCVLKDDGTVWCWGGNASGQLGNLSTTDSLAPVHVAIGNDNEYVSVGYEHVCVKKTNGNLWCWGDNLYGEVGTGSASLTELQPTKVMTNVKKVSAGGFFTCVIKTDDTLWCWGDNADGHLGVGDVGDHRVPTQVTALGNNVMEVDASVRATCAVTKDGAAWCWGWPDQGRLGDGRDCKGQSGPQYQVPTPQRVNGPIGKGGVKKIYTREGTACVVTTADEIWCWGAGVYPDGQGLHLEPVKVDFCSLPDLEGISPKQGPAVGGNTVTLTGTDFQDGVKAYFDAQLAKSVHFVSATKIEAVPPSHEPGTVDVKILNPGKHPARLLQAYQYVLGPTFDNISPDRGPLTGGTSFTVSGTGFSNKVKVTIGGKPATDVQVKDDSTVSGKTPPSDNPGAVDIVVTNDDEQTAEGKGSFTYVAAPVLTSVKPNTGDANGGENVTIVGDGFTWDTTIKFGGVQAGVQLDDAQTLTVTTPPHEAGKVDITAEDQYGQMTTLAQAFTYTGKLSPDQDGGAGGQGNGNPSLDGDGGDVPVGVWSCAVSSTGDDSGDAGGALGAFGWLVFLGALISRRRQR